MKSQRAAVFSRISISTNGEADDSRRVIPSLTMAFVSDLHSHPGQPVLLLFDTVDGAVDIIRDWLMDMLLVQLVALPYVRCVIAGRDLPDAAGGYAAFCQSYELQPVKEEEAYIRFCHLRGIGLAEQSIRDIARASDYYPGFFAELAFRAGGNRGG